MKRNLMKYVINFVLISSIFVFNSCVEYNITWRNYSSYSDTTIFLFSQDNERIRLRLDRTTRFRVFSPIERIRGHEGPKGFNIHIHPFFNQSRSSEIFFYREVYLLYGREGKVIVEPREGVVAYFAIFYINDLRYIVISRDNILIMTEPQKPKIMEEILLRIDCVDFTYIIQGRAAFNGSVSVGYIVRSNIDNSLIWLNSGIRWIL